MSEEKDWLGEIEQRCSAATPGPWKAEPRPEAGQSSIQSPDGRVAVVAWWFDGGRTKATMHDQSNAEFIAHAREDVPRLIAEVRRLREERESLEPIRQRAAHLLGVEPEAIPLSAVKNTLLNVIAAEKLAKL